jgi:hypothetical protein
LSNNVIAYRPPRYVPKLQAAAIKAQAAAVQNTYYTVLDTVYNVVLDYAVMRMETAAEDIETRFTIDGLVLSGTQGAAVAGTDYSVYIARSANGMTANVTTTTVQGMITSPLPCRSLKVEIRKTTANGANTLKGCVIYHKW